MLTEIERLDAIAREHGSAIYAVLQRNAGWGVEWYEGGDALLFKAIDISDPEWRKRLVVYDYYPTIKEMCTAEARRLSEL